MRKSETKKLFGLEHWKCNLNPGTQVYLMFVAAKKETWTEEQSRRLADVCNKKIEEDSNNF